MTDGRITQLLWEGEDDGAGVAPGALKIGFAGLAATLLLSVQVNVSAQQGNAAPAAASPTSSQRQFLDRYCVTCHNERLKSGGLSLARVDLSKPGAQPELWEKVVRKLHTGVMPPPNMPQPSAGRSPRDADMAGNIARCGGGRKAESWPHRNAATPESNRVSERDQGPAGARHRRRLASAGR